MDIHLSQTNLLSVSTDKIAGRSNLSGIDQDLGTPGRLDYQSSECTGDGVDLGTSWRSSLSSPTCCQGLHHDVSIIHLNGIKTKSSNLRWDSGDTLLNNKIHLLSQIIRAFRSGAAGRRKSDSLQVSHNLTRGRRVKWGSKEYKIPTLQSTWLVTSVKEGHI